MPTHRLDPASVPGARTINPADSSARHSVTLVAVPSGVGAKDRRCAAGPIELLQGGLLERLAARGIDVRAGATLAPLSGLSPHAVIADLGNRLAREMGDVLDAGRFPLVLGGDHSCAIGTWSGVAAALAKRGEAGLVWIDAHMDSHTSATSWTGNVHGMPLAALLGVGTDPRIGRNSASLAQRGALLAKNVCLVGIRSYEPEEAALLAALGVRVFDIAEVKRRGIDAVLEDAVDIAATGTAGYGFSIDLDAIDPEEAPGVGTPVADGIAGGELVKALRAHALDPLLVALEIVEYNPKLDRGLKTAALVEEVIGALLAPLSGY